MEPKSLEEWTEQIKKDIAEKAEADYERLFSELKSLLHVRAWKRRLELGTAIGRSRNYVNKLLKRQTPLKLLDFLKLLAALGVDLKDLVGHGRRGRHGLADIEDFLLALERRQLGERAQQTGAAPRAVFPAPGDTPDFDEERAQLALPLLTRYLGLKA